MAFLILLMEAQSFQGCPLLVSCFRSSSELTRSFAPILGTGVRGSFSEAFRRQEEVGEVAGGRIFFPVGLHRCEEQRRLEFESEAKSRRLDPEVHSRSTHPRSHVMAATAPQVRQAVG
ncbi:hypothetical protein BCR34DRAFT_170253 [Clohesyomyces aquaticus]|uniref:Secreted protein n=1 Tax=Clohesyomyces aquaticus TaxID=1231657 RepID=A0A1Y1ZZA2_9PLEO|nr:hypothetical protein BCR34DRAFT_170253 [Clohesyomyces aquaticus]